MGGLLKDLNLTQAQKDQIKTKLEADGGEADRRGDCAVQGAARGDEGPARRQAPDLRGCQLRRECLRDPSAGAKPPQAEGHADHFAKELQVIVSVLDGTQREALAKKIEAGPPAHTAPPAQQ